MDSPHNKKLIEEIPWWLQDPEGQKGYTCYRGVTGKGCAFEGGKTVAAVPAGNPSPIAVVMTKESCPWTKPEDVPVEEVEKGECLRWFTDGWFTRGACLRRWIHVGIGSGGGPRGWRKINPPVKPWFRFAK